MRPALPAVRGLAWIVEGALLARRAGGAFFVGCLLVGLVNALPLVGVFAGLAMPVFYAGLVRLLATAEAGQAPRAAQAFAGFLEPGAFARLLPVLLVHLAFVVAVMTLVVAAGGEELSALAESAQAGVPATKEQSAAVAARIVPTLMALLPVALLVQWLQMLAVPRAMLDGVGGGTALREAAVAVLRQLWPLLVNFFGLIPVVLLILLVFMVSMALLGALEASAPALALFVQVPVLAGLVAAFVGVNAPVMLRAAREVFDETSADASPPLPPDQIEV